jgi:hypothetical protein
MRCTDVPDVKISKFKSKMTDSNRSIYSLY